jgi:4-hydroxybenzoate polyprenyltransferase
LQLKSDSGSFRHKQENKTLDAKRGEAMRGVSNGHVPLCVDLDGTLVKTDTLLEAVLALLRKNPLYLMKIVLWVFKGKASFKQEVASRVDIDVSTLPFNETFLKYLREQVSQGRRVILTTAANAKYAHAVARHLGFFDQVISSDGDINLSGKRKAERLVKMLGSKGFDYAGNSISDVPVWESARTAILVNPSGVATRVAERFRDVDDRFAERSSVTHEIIASMRLHQWSKNSLLFIPLFTSHQFLDTSLILQVLLAFLAFSLCASSIYFINDILDLQSDRTHPRKRFRPLAAGRLSIALGIAMIPILISAAVVISLPLRLEFVQILGVYCLASIMYSLIFKRLAIVDVVVLAGLYVVRVLAGAASVGVTMSFWLLAFSMFIFLSVAFAKRSAELRGLDVEARELVFGRGYEVRDLAHLSVMGMSSGYLSVLVLALYINSSDVMLLYSAPEILWLACPVLLYWVSRVWLKVGRGEMDDDPIVFVFGDRASQISGLIILVLVALATLSG